ncbi:MAG TPA: hypothetical protein DD434_09195 [Bacteroidales bacterium]|nr:hypothetical protein [Bacteroidales bacterium]
MRKNFRKIPTSILEKIQNIDGDLIIGAVINLSEDDFINPFYSDFNLTIKDGLLSYESEIVPSIIKGTFSKRNIDGYKIKFPERPKISKSYYVGERPIFGDYSKGTFSMYISRKVIDFIDIPPKEISLIFELLDKKTVNGKDNYIIKISTSHVLNQSMTNFYDELFFNLNILQENIGAVDVFSTTSTREEFLSSLQLNWEIFPPGEKDEDFDRITNGINGLNPLRLDEITERLQFLREEKPVSLVKGVSGMHRYFGAKFSDNLVVFENIRYGNAIYILFENWMELCRLSRLEIQSRPPDQYIRIPHTGEWKRKVKAIIKAKR